MDTKWKRSSIVAAFAAFFIGMALLIQNFCTMIGLLSAADEDWLKGQINDYQETQEFRWFISDYLDSLLDVATEGEYELSYEMVYEETYEENYPSLWETLFYRGEVPMAETAAASTEELVFEEAEDQKAWEREQQQYRKKLMENYSKDKNLRYVIVRGETLLYTNMETLKSYVNLQMPDIPVEEQLSAEEYNFFLWFNANGDGKVQIVKNGREVDIYGDGVYTRDSRWFLPGYTNFEADASAEDVKIFLAVAREPKIYVTGSYSEYDTGHIGSRLYYMKQDLEAVTKEVQTLYIEIMAAFCFLILAFCLRKGRKSGAPWVAEGLQKIWLDVKVIFLFAVPGAMAAVSVWQILDLPGMRGNSSWYIDEMTYYAGYAKNYGTALAVAFCLLYLWRLDRTYNAGQQKHLLKPVIDSLRTKHLQLPLQQQMVKRYRLLVILQLLFWLGSFGIFLLTRLLYIGWDYSILFVLTYAVLVGGVYLVFAVWYMKQNKETAEDLGRLSDQIEKIRSGNLTEKLALPKEADLRKMAQDLEEIQQGLENALEEQIKSERMKVELITNVSHDIKTPLTSIISYVELLKQEEELPEYVKDYVQILGEKSARLKSMVQDVFEVSKAAAGQLPVELERLDYGKLLKQTLADMDEAIQASSLQFKLLFPELPVYVQADGQRMYRVFQNLIQNALNYSLGGSRVFLILKENGDKVDAVVKNISRVELEPTTDFTERFVRGDKSRTDGGSGLGLSIAQSFTEACGGTLTVETDADLFTVTVSLPKF